MVSVDSSGHVPQKLAMRELRQWAYPRKGLTLDELVEKMAELGNPVLEIDRANNRLLVTYVRQEFNE